ncbi:MAG: RNA polymerase sigma factor [Actinomycetota bacterium]
MKDPHIDFLEAALPATDRIYNIARRATRNRQDAEDLVQETYLRAFNAWKYHRRPENIDAWLATICLNLIRSQYRWRSRRPDELLSADPGSHADAGDNTAGQALESVTAEVVRRAVSDLPEEQRIAVTLVDLAGFTASETARIMGSPRGTVLSRVHRGRKALSRRLSSQRVTDREP